MCDLLKKNGINIDVKALSKKLGCPIIETSALKKTGLKEVIAEAIKVAKSHAAGTVSAIFESSVEDKVSAIEAELPSSIPDAEKRWYAIKVLENDSKVAEQLGLVQTTVSPVTPRNWRKSLMMTLSPLSLTRDMYTFRRLSRRP